MLSNPPFSVEWKKVQAQVTKEHKELGYGGRFGAGLPRVSDGSLLFLLHLISKMSPKSELCYDKKGKLEANSDLRDYGVVE